MRNTHKKIIIINKNFPIWKIRLSIYEIPPGVLTVLSTRGGGRVVFLFIFFCFFITNRVCYKALSATRKYSTEIDNAISPINQIHNRVSTLYLNIRILYILYICLVYNPWSRSVACVRVASAKRQFISDDFFALTLSLFRYFALCRYSVIFAASSFCHSFSSG